MNTVNTLAAKKRCFDIIERFPKEQLITLVVSLEAMYTMVEEAADDAFCVALAERHDKRKDKNAPGMDIEDFADMLGITLSDDGDD